MQILVAVDSFKGSASSVELGAAVAAGIAPLQRPGDSVQVVPVSDGGDGAMAVVQAACGGTLVQVATINSLGVPMMVPYLITMVNNQRIAVIESAQVVGLQYSDLTTNDGYQATSYGLGALIRDALQQHVSQIIITLGGTGTTDGGLGLIQALGGVITDANGKRISRNGNPLITAAQVDLPAIKGLLGTTQLVIASDVQSPYAGLSGAAHVFGPQKGLTAAQIMNLDTQLMKIGAQLGVTNRMGAGAAGGLGGGLLALGATMASGFEVISKLVNLPTAIAAADVIITGEGQIDGQSSQGKVLNGISQLAHASQTPVIAICGGQATELGEFANQFAGIFSIQPGPMTLTAAVEPVTTLTNTSKLAANLYRLLTISPLN